VIDAVTRILAARASGRAPLPGRDIAVICLWAAAGLTISVRFFRWNPQRPVHRRGGRR
jgi:hypothetical protein